MPPSNLCGFFTSLLESVVCSDTFFWKASTTDKGMDALFVSVPAAPSIECYVTQRSNVSASYLTNTIPHSAIRIRLVSWASARPLNGPLRTDTLVLRQRTTAVLPQATFEQSSYHHHHYPPLPIATVTTATTISTTTTTTFLHYHFHS